MADLTDGLANGDSRRLAMKRGRPTARAGAKIERVILITAGDMFVSQGFGGVSMEGIAASVGVTRATLYSRYATKQALFRAVIENMIAQWYARESSAAPSAAGDIGDVLRGRVSDMAALLVDPQFRMLHTLLQSSRHHFPELAPMMHQLGYQKAVHLLASDIRAAAERDHCPASRPDVVAAHVITAVYGWFVQHDLVGSPTREDIEMHGHKVIDLLLRSRDGW